MEGIRVTVEQAREADRPALRRLMQLYCHDFSEMVDMPLSRDGLFGDPEFIDEQFGPNHQTYVIRAGAGLAGFAIVTDKSGLTGMHGVTDMAQFFVLRSRRRGGVGRRASISIFERRPGPWEVRVVRENPAALAFWKDAIDKYTRGAYKMKEMDTERLRGTLFTFDAGAG